MSKRERFRKILARAGLMSGGTLIIGLIIEKFNTPDHFGLALPVAAAAAYILAWTADSKSTEAVLGNESLTELNPLLSSHPSKKDLYTPTRMTIEVTGLVLSVSQPEFGIGFATMRIMVALNNLRVDL